MPMPIIRMTPVEAVSIEASRESADKIESLMDVYSQPDGDEIIVDTRPFDDGDERLTQLAAILLVPEVELQNSLVCVYW